MADIKECINKMVEINRKIDKLKAEYDGYEAQVLARFYEDTKDTKYKAVAYAAENGNVTVCNTDKVNVIYPAMLRKIFGNTYSDMVEKRSLTPSAHLRKSSLRLFTREST